MTPRAAWAAGSAKYFIEKASETGLLVTAVECRVHTEQERYFALLDTGAQWSLIGGALAQRVCASVGSGGPSLALSTRLGKHSGTLERFNLTLLAKPGHGRDLSVEATVLVAPSWTGPIMLGTRGLLERVRFELDPDQTGDDCWWSFAPANR